MSNPSVFISYRRDDDTKWVAALLPKAFAQYLPGVEVFLDVDSIEPGLDFKEVLTRTLDRCEVLLALIGKKWLTIHDEAGRRRIDNEADWVRAEVARALARNIRVIPILVDGTPMPKEEFLNTSLLGLSRRQACSVDFENRDSGIENILRIVSRTSNVQLANLPSESSPTISSSQASASAILEIFEEGSPILTVLAEHQLDLGRFALALAMFDLVASRQFKALQGPPDVNALRTKYDVARAKLLVGKFTDGAKDLEWILPWIERERDESYPLYIKAQAALARAHLEEGDVDAAKKALPTAIAPIFRDQSITADLAWIAHLEGRGSSRDELLRKLDGESAFHPPTLEFFRSISRLRETMQRSSTPPTMVWKPDRL